MWLNFDSTTFATGQNNSDLFFIAPFLALAKEPIPISILLIGDIHLQGISIGHFVRAREERAFVRKL